MSQRSGQELGVRDVLITVEAKLLQEFFDVGHGEVDLREALVDLSHGLQHLLLADSA